MKQPRTPPYPLRMPDELRQWMSDRAKENLRSLQGEILHRLQESKANEEAKRNRRATD